MEGQRFALPSPRGRAFMVHMDTAAAIEKDDDVTTVRAEVVDILTGAVVRLLLEGRCLSKHAGGAALVALRASECASLIAAPNECAHAPPSPEGLLSGAAAGEPGNPATRQSAARPSSVPGQLRRTASAPDRRTTERKTQQTMMASSA